jgi:3-keto-5-aminohexanoate cleavage enzyme
VLNVPGAVPYSVENLTAFMRGLPQGADFTVMGIGRSSLPAQYGALANGGWIRVGFEDNVYYSKGVLAKNNAELVERAARISHEAGLKPATPGRGTAVPEATGLNTRIGKQYPPERSEHA